MEKSNGKNSSLSEWLLMSRPFKEERSSKSKVLLVDDSMKAITPLHMLFCHQGYSTILSFDGESAIDEISRAIPQLIILDWNMPDLSGGEAILYAQKIMDTQREKLGYQFFKKIPVITFSGTNLKQLKMPECSNFEFVDHWQKPMSLSQLSKKVAGCNHLMNP